MSAPVIAAFAASSAVITSVVYHLAGGRRPAGYAMGALVVGGTAGLVAYIARDRIQQVTEAREPSARFQRWIECPENPDEKCVRFAGRVRDTDGHIGTRYVLERLRREDVPKDQVCTVVRGPDGQEYLRGTTQDASVFTDKGRSAPLRT